MFLAKPAVWLCVRHDPDDEEYDEMLEWVGGDFDPELFDAKITTVRMVRGLRGRR